MRVFILLFLTIYNTAFAQAGPCKDETQKAEMFYDICLKFDKKSAGYIDCIKIFMDQKAKSLEICKNPSAAPPVATPKPEPPAPAPTPTPAPAVIAPIVPPVAEPKPEPPAPAPAPAAIAPIVPPAATPAPAPVVAQTVPAEQQKESFTDPRDKKTYKTVKIGEQVWMAENLNYNASGSKCYDNKKANCEKYGRLYDWATAKKACPLGWHLPRDAEWESLHKVVDCAGFDFADSCGFFGSTPIINDGVHAKDHLPKLFSVRCIQGEPQKVATEKSAFTDTRDNKNYKTVKISLKSGSQTIISQTWMTENLNYNAAGSKCYKNNQANCTKYGRLYNRETAMKACPADWHLPTNEEWDILVNFADGDKPANKLKAKTGWKNKGNGTNEYNFTALPDSSGSSGNWWSSVYGNDGKAVYRAIYGNDEYSVSEEYHRDSLSSVRCMKDICYEQPYKSETHFCDYTKKKIYQKCGNLLYNPNIQVCKGNDIFDKCYEKEYNIATQFCHSDKKVYDKCDGKTYNPPTEICNGEKKVFHKNGKLQLSGNYKNKKQEGKWEEYYDNGNLKSAGNYKNGNKDGKWEGYYANGNLQSIKVYKDGKPDAKWEEYYVNRNLKSAGYYKDGKPDGKWEEYYVNGNFQSIKNYKGGKPDGKWETYLSDGSPKSVENYIDGKKL
jgi:uncharacterized protein (TIGR02145 family)